MNGLELKLMGMCLLPEVGVAVAFYKIHSTYLVASLIKLLWMICMNLTC